MGTSSLKYLASLFDLSGKVAVVTGASGGLGRFMAKALAVAGATTIVVGRREDGLKETVRLIEEAGGRGSLRICDVVDLAAVRTMIADVASEHGGLDILVNGAGVTAMVPSLEMTEAQWDRVIDTNLKASFFVSQAAARVMIPRGSGKIINIGSITSSVGLPGRVSYTASKGGVVMLTRTLATEWAAHGINVNAIAPGFFRTSLNAHLFDDPTWRENLLRQIPAGRPGSPADLEGATLFLASKASDYVTGQVIYVDGGYTAGETNLNLPSHK